MVHQVYATFRLFFYSWVSLVVFQAAKSLLLFLLPSAALATTVDISPVIGSLSSVTNLKNPFISSAMSLESVEIQKIVVAKNYILRGTLVGGSQARAIIEDKKTGEQRWVLQGDSLDGAKVVAIERNELKLKRGTSLMKLVLHLETLLPEEQKNNVFEVAENQVDSKPRVKQIAENEYLINQSFLQFLTSKIPKMLSTLELILFEIDKGPQGYLVSAGPEIFSIAGMGLQDGDLIKKINAQSLNSEQDLLAALENLSQQTVIHLEIDRDERILTYTYHVQP